MPPAEFDDAYLGVALRFFVIAEITYCISCASIKTSIGLALMRTICVKRRYRYTVLVTIVGSTCVFLASILWFCASCRPMYATWDHDAAQVPGTCHYGGYLVLVYLTFTAAVATDVAFAAVPLLALRHLRMPPRTKYPLMAVFSLGILAAVASACRFSFVPLMSNRFSPQFMCEFFSFFFFALCLSQSITKTLLADGSHTPPSSPPTDEMTWIGLLSIIECSVGLIAGSMPFIGRLFNLYESGKPHSDAGHADLVNPTIGSTPPRRARNKTSSVALFSMGTETTAGESSASRGSFAEHGQDDRGGEDEDIGLQKSDERHGIVQSPDAAYVA